MSNLSEREHHNPNIVSYQFRNGGWRGQCGQNVISGVIFGPFWDHLGLLGGSLEDILDVPTPGGGPGDSQRAPRRAARLLGDPWEGLWGPRGRP